MVRFYAGVFQVAFLTLGHFEREFQSKCDQGLGELPLDESMLEKFSAVTKVALNEAEKVGFQKALDRRANCEMYAQLKMLTYNSAYHELKELREALHQDLYKRFALLLTDEERVYFDKVYPFGRQVYDNFESARQDIREACNCYALDRPTACVFHLTRVLERGLFVLVQDPKMGITLKDAREETWETLINKIESFIKDVQNQKRSLQKGQDLELYSGAAMQFRYFKDHWRNPISHCRTVYDAAQALSSMAKVQELMVYLAMVGMKEELGMILP